MTREKIEKAADEYANDLYDSDDCRMEKRAFIAGAEFMQTEIDKLKNDKFADMQFYMEYVQKNGYVTPMDWYANHKHY